MGHMVLFVRGVIPKGMVMMNRVKIHFNGLSRGSKRKQKGGLKIMHKITIGFGRDNLFVLQKEFNTIAEAEAYLEGVGDMDGWLEYEVLNFGGEG